MYLALNIFERRSSSGFLPAAVQRDIGASSAATRPQSSGSATRSSRRATARTAAAVGAAAARDAGVLDAGDGDCTFHASLLDRQPAPVRVILGCAERLEPLPPDADLVKVHGSGDCVSYLRFDGFSQGALPVLAQRTVVDLRRRRVVEVDADTPDGRRVLLGRASFMPPGLPGRERQERFDGDLRRRGVLKQDGLGPGLRAFVALLTAAGVRLHGGRGAEVKPRSTPGADAAP